MWVESVVGQGTTFSFSLPTSDNVAEFSITPAGIIGDTGSLDGTKLHFAVFDKSDPVDPRAWLGR